MQRVSIVSDFDFVQQWTNEKRPIWFVTGTDTDVGKTVVTAQIAEAVREHFGSVTIVKPIQTGLGDGEAGDAATAGLTAGCSYIELIRLRLPADPWLAALDAGYDPIRIDHLRERIEQIDGPLVVEGAGGIMVPLNAAETFVDLVIAVKAEVIIVVGLRLGCISHAILTATVLQARNAHLAGFILVDRWGRSDVEYVMHLRRVLEPLAPVVAYLPHIDGLILNSR